MTKTLEKNDSLKTVGVDKDTWVLEVPVEICKREGFPQGTLVSLTLKDNAIIGEYLKPSKDIDDFVSRIVEEEAEYFKEIQLRA